MTETTNPIVQAVHDAIEAAIAATATELSQAVGFVGPATADQIRDRVEQLKDTLGQYLCWVNQAINVVNAAYAVSADPAQLPALRTALEKYHQARTAPVAPGQPTYTLRVPAPSPWLSAIDAAISALRVGADHYSAEVAGLKCLRSELIGEGAPEIDAVWPAWPDAAEQLWASILAQVDAEPDLVTHGDDGPCGVEREIVTKQPLEIEVLIAIDAHGLLTCTPPTGVRVRVFDYACQDGAETYLFTSDGEVERQPLAEEHVDGVSAADSLPQYVTLTDVDESGRQRAALIYLSEFIEIVIPRPGGVIPGRINPAHELAVARVELLEGDVRIQYWIVRRAPAATARSRCWFPPVRSMRSTCRARRQHR